MKKGFTLAELIGVIVVLALICLITVPAVASVLQQNKKSLCKTQLKNILVAANSYASENLFSMPTGIDGDDSISIELNDLISGGFIDGNITNPVTKEEFNSEIQIDIKKVGKKLEIDFADSNIYDLCEDED